MRQPSSANPYKLYVVCMDALNLQLLQFPALFLSRNGTFGRGCPSLSRTKSKIGETENSTSAYTDIVSHRLLNLPYLLNNISRNSFSYPENSKCDFNTSSPHLPTAIGTGCSIAQQCGRKGENRMFATDL